MHFTILFFANSIFLGIALAMDAFSVSIANSVVEPYMNKKKMVSIAIVYGIFQFVMPLIGYILVHNFIVLFDRFRIVIPYISLGLLLYLGIKMILEVIKEEKDEDAILDTNIEKITLKVLILQGVATSIDALSVGFTISEYSFIEAIVESTIIGVITFIICMCGLVLGRKIGEKFENKAQVIGGVILIIIGIEIFVKGVFFR